VDDAEAGAGEHGDGQLGDHGHVDGDAVAGFEFGEIAEHGGNFVHTFVELLIGDHYGWFVFRFGDENQSGFVLVFGEMAVNAIVAGVEFPADEPFPERRIGSVEGFAPGLVPIEETGVMVEAFGEIFFAEFLTKAGSARLACVMNFLEGRKYCSSFQWTAIWASVSLCFTFDDFASSFRRTLDTAATPFGSSE